MMRSMALASRLSGVLVVGVAFAMSLSPVQAAASPECGEASWYDESAGASGGLAAAHPSLPFGTKVIVENLGNGRIATLEINDRGPFTGGRIIDVTRDAAVQLDFIEQGVARVRISATDAKGATTVSCR